MRRVQIIIAALTAALEAGAFAASCPPVPGSVRAPVADAEMQEDRLQVEHLTFASSWDQTSPLYAYVVYPQDGRHLPVIFNTPGYHETSWPYRVKLNRYLASEGWFVVWVDMRGRGGSAGKHDSGGLEIHDIYDAVQAVKRAYGDLIDPGRIGFQGESGGGGNAVSCLVKLPDTFCVGASFFGIPDYAKWQEILNMIGQADSIGPAKILGATAPQAPDRYLVRNATLAAANNPYSPIFLFNDEEESTCWPVMDRAFKRNADTAGLTNVVLNVSDKNSAIRTRHRSSFQELRQARQRYLDPLKNGAYPVPTIKTKGEFTVLGFIITKAFSVYCGDGQDAVARVGYRLQDHALTFNTTPLSSDPEKPILFKLPKTHYKKVIAVEVNNQAVPIADKQDHFVFTAATLKNTIRAKIIPAR